MWCARNAVRWEHPGNRQPHHQPLPAIAGEAQERVQGQPGVPGGSAESRSSQQHSSTCTTISGSGASETSSGGRSSGVCRPGNGPPSTDPWPVAVCWDTGTDTVEPIPRKHPAGLRFAIAFSVQRGEFNDRAIAAM